MTDRPHKDAVAIARSWRDTFARLEGGVNRSLARSLVTPSCAQGCSHCCNQYVDCSLTEGIAIAVRLREQPALLRDFEAALPELLERLRAMGELDMVSWFAASRGCVFLGIRGQCRIYEHRPLVCLTYYVASPPELCAVGAFGNISRVDCDLVESYGAALAQGLAQRAGIPGLWHAMVGVSVAWGLRISRVGVDAGVRHFASLPDTDVMSPVYWQARSMRWFERHAEQATRERVRRSLPIFTGGT